MHVSRVSHPYVCVVDCIESTQGKHGGHSLTPETLQLEQGLREQQHQLNRESEHVGPRVFCLHLNWWFSAAVFTSIQSNKMSQRLCVLKFLVYVFARTQ